MSFEALPRELQLIIVCEHLRLPPWEPSPYLWPREKPPIEPPTFDLKLALDFAIVSPSCRDIISSILLRRVRITRPSSLHSLFTTLSQRPDLAVHVRSIHLGPDKNPKHGHYRWPVAAVSHSWPKLMLRSSLDEHDDKAIAPTWYSHGFLWYDHYHIGSCTSSAVSGAINASVEALDIEPWRRGYSKSGLHIGIRAWAARIFLLAAALDLYMMHMRQIEDARAYGHAPHNWPDRKREDCQRGDNTCSHKYPRFRIISEASRLKQYPVPRNDARGVFVVTEAQLWEHLERRGGPADDFDHPTFLTSSTPQGLHMFEEEWKRVRDVFHGPGYAQLQSDVHWRKILGYDPYQELQPVYDPLQKMSSGKCRYQEAAEEERAAGSKRFPSPSSDDFDMSSEVSAPRGRSDRAEDLLAMTRYILGLMPQVNNVSLTSILFRALPGLQGEALRSLTIGPRARHWNEVLPADVTALGNLQRLRVVGMMSQTDATKIALQLSLLQEVEWEVTDENRPETYTDAPAPFYPLDIATAYDVVCTLQGRRDPKHPTANQDQCFLGKRTRQLADDGECKSDGSPDSQALRPASPAAEASFFTHDRTTLVLLRPEVADDLLDMAPSPELRQAWEEGRLLPGTLHSVRIGVSKAVEPPIYSWRNSYSDEMKILYDAGRKWWKEGHTGPPAVEGGGVILEGSEGEGDDEA